MATKVEKRKVRKEKNAEALGLDISKETKNSVKKEIKKKNKEKNSAEKKQKGQLTTWVLFFINIFLIWFILRFRDGF